MMPTIGYLQGILTTLFCCYLFTIFASDYAYWQSFYALLTLLAVILSTMALTHFTKSKKPNASEQLHINMRKGQANGRITALKYVDNDTKQHVIYLPSLQLSGYGETVDKAEIMIRFLIDDFFNHLTSLSSKEVNMELHSLGWHRGLFKKEYSHAYVDANGELQNLNAENDKVERVTLHAEAA